MNGFGLLIAVATLGVEVGWEAGPGGQSYYTIHIEKLLLEPLREGQAIVSNVDVNDRNLTRFQIIVGDHAHAISSQPGPSASDMVQHGWRPGENGGTDYLIQISPERLESLAKGSSIIGQIDAKVTDIRKLYVFSGVQQLPQQLPAASAPPPPQKFLGVGGGLRPASGETTQPNDSPTRVGAPAFNNTQFNGSAGQTGVGQTGAGQAGGGQFSGGQFSGGQFNSGQFNGGQLNGGQFSGGQSPATGRANDFPASGGAYAGGASNNFNPNPNTAAGGATQFDNRFPAQDQWRTGGQTNAAWPNGGYAAAGGAGVRNGVDERMLPVSQLPGSPQPGQYAYGGSASSQPSEQQLELLMAQAKAQGALEAKAAAAEAKAVAAEAKAAIAAQTPAAVTPTPNSNAQQEDDTPWWPLVLTTMMLFASLGTNVFLGWLAWSYFWRFRDAAGDATRAQSTLFPTRQAA